MAKKTASKKKAKKQKQLFGVWDQTNGNFVLHSQKPRVELTKTVVSDGKGGWKDSLDDDVDVYVSGGNCVAELCEEVTDFIPNIKSGVVYKLTVTAVEA